MRSQPQLLRILPTYISERKKPINYQNSDFEIFKDYFVKEIKSFDVQTFKNCILVQDSLLTKHPLKIQDQLSHAIPFKCTAKLKRLALNYSRKVKYLEKAAWGIDNWSDNYFHWMGEALPRMYMMKDLLQEHPFLLPHSYRKLRFVQESMELLDLPFIFYDPKINYKIGELKAGSRMGNVGEFQQTALQQLSKAFIGEFQEKPFRKIYISRKDAQYRKVLNEPEVESVFSDFGYEIQVMEKFSLKDQVTMIRQCSHLAGLHGAGLSNMMFMPEGGKVLEFRNMGDSWSLSQSFFAMASDLGHEYYYTLNPATSQQTGFADFKIDLEKLKQVLKLMADN
ncbi:glycosyltransferase family 61 protein [Arthrospiribacter ruber]|uniref:Glycosyltransferase family 61 protein n=1 Tax=Arthrospiribacter ruber TaxID=2487934 RepID=A0A951IQU9_9BACT|nr:glycosyltransferase family 61 protein [Arthrospiribacter ruber]MBW3466393.1 glycosyltransferase family 61 protein [Arthrospiribacter ruber]